MRAKWPPMKKMCSQGKSVQEVVLRVGALWVGMTKWRLRTTQRDAEVGVESAGISGGTMTIADGDTLGHVPETDIDIGGTDRDLMKGLSEGQKNKCQNGTTVIEERGAQGGIMAGQDQESDTIDDRVILTEVAHHAIETSVTDVAIETYVPVVVPLCTSTHHNLDG